MEQGLPHGTIARAGPGRAHVKIQGERADHKETQLPLQKKIYLWRKGRIPPQGKTLEIRQRAQFHAEQV